jgi:cell division protein YceG involved in septum cleavage
MELSGQSRNRKRRERVDLGRSILEESRRRSVTSLTERERKRQRKMNLKTVRSIVNDEITFERDENRITSTLIRRLDRDDD